MSTPAAPVCAARPAEPARGAHQHRVRLVARCAAPITCASLGYTEPFTLSRTLLATPMRHRVAPHAAVEPQGPRPAGRTSRGAGVPRRLFAGRPGLLRAALPPLLHPSPSRPQLWAVPGSGAVIALLELANAAGLVMLVSGLLSRDPARFAGKPLAEPRGVHRITRHPVFMGVTVMALAHGVANGHASDVAFFGGIAVFALASCRYQDLRKLAGGDAAFRRIHAATAFVPFARRGAMRGLRELSPLAVGLGLAVALAARCLHPSTGGCGLLP